MNYAVTFLYPKPLAVCDPVARSVIALSLGEAVHPEQRELDNPTWDLFCEFVMRAAMAIEEPAHAEKLLRVELSDAQSELVATALELILERDFTSEPPVTLSEASEIKGSAQDLLSAMQSARNS